MVQTVRAAKDCDQGGEVLCDTSAPWSMLWTSGNSDKCLNDDGTFNCSHECVSELDDILAEGGYKVMDDSECTTSKCLRSQDFVWSCLKNDCYEIGNEMSDACLTETNCTKQCLVMYSDIELASRCNCYTEDAHPNAEHCNARNATIQSCYQLYVNSPVIAQWIVPVVIVLVLLLLVAVVVASLYYFKPKLFYHKKDTLEALAGSIVWDKVRELSKSRSKEVVIMLPYKFEHRTYAKVLKVFPNHRSDVYQGEMEIHEAIGNFNKNIIAVHAMGVIATELVDKLHIRFQGLQPGTQVRYLMLDYCKKGSLLDVLQKKDMSLYKVLRVGVDICNALKYLQTKKIIHMDIKPANIFVTGGNMFLLGDFGMAVDLNDPKHQKQLELKGGTYPYYPPEYIKRGREYVLHDAAREPMKIDIYQLGLLLWECQIRGGGPGFKRRPPYNTEVEQYKVEKKVTLETMARLFSHNPTCRPQFQDGSNQSIVKLIQSCWDTSVPHRPDVTSLHHTLQSTLREEMIRCNLLCNQPRRVDTVVHGRVDDSGGKDFVIDLLSSPARNSNSL